MDSCSIVIIGGGIIGTATSYYLTKLGIDDVIVLEKDDIASGSTGRCGAGVRQQWGLEMNCRLAKGSVHMYESLSEELDFDIEFRQGGYLVLAHTQNQVEQFEKNLEVQNSLGIPSRMITVDEALEIVPYLNPETFVAATFCPTDGHANPFLTNYAYARAAQKRGVDIRKFTEAKDIITEDGKIQGVLTNRGKIAADIVVNAAGGYSQDVADMAGVDVPNYSERHQILVTEPVESLYDCMVISFQTGFYTQQVPHGSFIVGMGEDDEPASYNTESSWDFLEELGEVVCETLPIMKQMRIVRQWAGLYNVTPDAQPIIGEPPSVDGFYQAIGFSGHGFMVAPMTTKILAQNIAGETPEMDVSALNLKRFEKGNLVLEPSVVG